jgi:Icc-related predicted phosphoesterase
MKILALSDIHGNTRTLSKILNKVKGHDIDLVLVAGDLTDFGSYNEAKSIIELISSSFSKVYFVPGNCDMIHDYKEDINKLNLHGNYLVYKEIAIIGLGGSSPTPFNTPLEFSEEEIEEILNSTYERLKNNYEKYEKLILLSHTPPINTKVDFVSSRKVHAGSLSVRKFVEKFSPHLVISGHVHEARNIDQINQTLLVNAGPASQGNYAIIDINESILIKLENV